MVKPGDVYGLLTVTEEFSWRVGGTGTRARIWTCLCACGRTHKVFASNLYRGGTKSCGCARGKHIGDRIRTHGMRGSRIYKIWMGMKARCNNPRDSSYKDYGGRGVKVAVEWMDFSTFYRDMGDPPPGMTIAREDTNGDYAPDNCRWATVTTQNQNRRLMHKNKSGVPGVWFKADTNRWVVTIGYDNRGHYVGTADNLLEAAAMRRSAELAHWSTSNTP